MNKDTNAISRTHEMEHGLFEVMCDIADGVTRESGKVTVPQQLRGVKNVQTFEAFGMRRQGRGLVVKMEDGTTFMISINRTI